MNFRQFYSSLDLSLPNILFAIGAAVASYIVIHVALKMFRARLGRLTEERAHKPVAEVLTKTLARTSSLAVVATSVLVGLSVLQLPPPWDQRVRHLWFVTLGLQIGLYLHRAIEVASRRYFRKHGRNGGAGDDQVTVAHTLVIWVLQSTVWVVFALALLSNLGINVTTFIASLGIGGIAIALAVQNVLGDLFASLSIAVDKPFEVGDSIAVSGFSGTVEHVGLKTTRVRADSGEQIVISNAELLKNTVRNYKRMLNRRIAFPLRICPDTAPALAAKVPPALREIIESKDKIRFDRAHLKVLDQNFLEFEVVYFVLDPSYALFMDTQQEILLEAMQMFEDLGISTASRPRQLLLQEVAANDVETAVDTPARPDGAVRPLHKGS